MAPPHLVASASRRYGFGHRLRLDQTRLNGATQLRSSGDALRLRLLLLLLLLLLPLLRPRPQPTIQT